jgi:undecaprenyl-diphosphatase
MLRATSRKRSNARVSPAVSFMSFGLVMLSVQANLFRSIDEAAGDWVRGWVTPAVTPWIFLWTDMASARFIIVFSIMLGVALALAGEGYWVKRLAWSLPGCMLSIELVKTILRRPRPSISDPMLQLTNYSFPSGHAASATVLYGFLALLICSYLTKGVWQTLVWIGTAVLITGVAFSRMYLGVHYVSDVTAGLILGISWLALSSRMVRSPDKA